MDTGLLLDLLGGTALASLLGAILAVVIALVAGTRHLRGGRLHPGIGAAAVGVPALVMLGMAWLNLNPDLHSLGRVTGYRLGAFFFAAPAMGVVALLAAITGVRSKPYAYGPAALTLALVAATVAVTLGGGVAVEDLAFPVLRSVLYAGVGALVAVACLARGAGAGPEAAGGAGVAFGLFVALGEVSGRAVGQLFLLVALFDQPTEDRAAFVTVGFQDVLDPMVGWHLAAMALGTLAGASALLPAWRAGRRRALIAGVWLLIVPLLWLWVDVTPGRLQAALFLLE